MFTAFRFKSLIFKVRGLGIRVAQSKFCSKQDLVSFSSHDPLPFAAGAKRCRSITMGFCLVNLDVAGLILHWLQKLVYSKLLSENPLTCSNPYSRPHIIPYIPPLRNLDHGSLECQIRNF